jgi:hypothetical protein
MSTSKKGVEYLAFCLHWDFVHCILYGVEANMIHMFPKGIDWNPKAGW